MCRPLIHPPTDPRSHSLPTGVSDELEAMSLGQCLGFVRMCFDEDSGGAGIVDRLEFFYIVEFVVACNCLQLTPPPPPTADVLEAQAQAHADADADAGTEAEGGEGDGDGEGGPDLESVGRPRSLSDRVDSSDSELSFIHSTRMLEDRGEPAMDLEPPQPPIAQNGVVSIDGPYLEVHPHPHHIHTHARV